MIPTVYLTKDRLESIFARIPNVRAAVIGDVCLDAYWTADMRISQLSRETPHHNLPVIEERYSLGGAGNVMNNMRALGAHVVPVTALGRDWRGMIVEELMRDINLSMDCTAIMEQRVTPCYVKPYRAGYGDVRYEDPRIDFENRAPLTPDQEDTMIAAVRRAAESADVIAVSDQLSYGVISPRVRDAIIAAAAAGKTVIVDSRDRIMQYPNCIVKPNELESARAVNQRPECVTPDAYLPVAQALSDKTGRSVIITLGGGGALCFCDGRAMHAPAQRVQPPIDIVGAGDTFLSACALAMGAGANLFDAVAFGNLASAVTIQKIGTTGVASPDEIRKQFGGNA